MGSVGEHCNVSFDMKNRFDGLKIIMPLVLLFKKTYDYACKFI